jgi:hypothetical protein
MTVGNFASISWLKHVIYYEMIMMYTLQHEKLDFNSVSSLVRSKTSNTNLIVFGLNRQEIYDLPHSK